MVKHVVLFKLKDNSLENKKDMVAKLLSMKGKIKELLDIESYYDIGNKDASFDVFLMCTVNSIEDVQKYAIDPVHIEVSNYLKSRIIGRQCVDFEV